MEEERRRGRASLGVGKTIESAAFMVLYAAGLVGSVQSADSDLVLGILARFRFGGPARARR